MKTVTIKTPCSKLWQDMSGDDRARFCADCRLTVCNFASLTRRQAEKLVRNSDRRVCGRLIFDDDGNPIFRAPAPGPLERLVQISLLGIAGFGGTAVAQQTCTLNIRVTGNYNATVPDANVTLDKDGQPFVNASTDKDGNFSQQLASGVYSVEVKSPGYATFSKDNIELDCSRSPVIQVDVPMKDFVGEVAMECYHCPPRWMRTLTRSLRRIFGS